MVIASIDIQGGKVVQLKQGSEKILEREDAPGLAREFAFYGEVAVIDLDAAMGKGSNEAMLKELLRLADCRVGGGVRTPEKAKEIVSWGAQKIIVGSKAFAGGAIDEAFLKSLADKIGKERVIVAVDSRNEKIVVDGWKTETGLDLYATAAKLDAFCGELLFTCVEREGTMTGIDMAQVRRLCEAVPNLKITAAGGVNSLKEIAELAKMGVDVQLGMALYTGAIKLDEAFVEGIAFDEKGLVPTIIQDTRGQVLTLAYSNRESLKKLFETRKTWLWSRSRNKLWMKGESSGNTQEVKSIRADCDRDALLIIVEPKGPACHNGNYSCFGYERYSLERLYEIVLGRLKDPVPGSYTASLDDDRVREKIMEEASELCLAKGKGELSWEAADLLYFTTILLAREGTSIADVIDELDRRHKK